MKTMKNISAGFICVAMLYIILPSPVFAQNDDNSLYLIKDAESAIERAIECTGFDKSRNFSYDSSIGIVELQEAVDTTTPFLHERINGRPAWFVEFKNILMNPQKYSFDRIRKYPKDFEVYLDAETGQLLRIFSPYIGQDKDRPFDVPRKEAEKQIGCEKYIGLLDSIPATSFYKAANASRHEIAMLAKEIHAVCISHARGDKVVKPTWMISLFGIPSMPLDLDIRNNKTGEFNRHSRLLVNAMTGEVIITIRSVHRVATEENK